MCEEFFERKKRRHPIWKSEAEYKAFFLQLTGKGALLENFEKAMEATAKYLTKVMFIKNTENADINSIPRIWTVKFLCILKFSLAVN